jgi:hypothetical protein
MSRTYSNFILFEDVLDQIPPESMVMKQAINMLLNPVVNIVEDDCNTLLGKMVDTNLELQGYTECATKEPMDNARIHQLLVAGSYRIGVRSLYTCQSYKLGGVCKLCYKAHHFGVEPDTSMGTAITIPALQIYQTDVLAGNGVSKEFFLSETSDDWYDVVVIKEGQRMSPSDYTLNFDSITFNTVPGTDPETDVIAVHFLKQNSDSFLGYIAKTYSGALLGIDPLPAIEPMLRHDLYEAAFSDSFIGMILDEVHKLKAIPSTYKNFMDQVHGKMERMLLALFLYAIYSNVEV